MENDGFVSSHKLSFISSPWDHGKGWPIPGDVLRFKIGTCEGKYQITDTTFDLLDVTNNERANGHFEDVLEWFIYHCKRERKDLRFMAINTERFRKHLINKRGFLPDARTANLFKPWAML